MELKVLVSKQGSKVLAASNLYHALQFLSKNYGVQVRKWMKDLFEFFEGIRQPQPLCDYTKRLRPGEPLKDFYLTLELSKLITLRTNSKYKLKYARLLVGVLSFCLTTHLTTQAQKMMLALQNSPEIISQTATRAILEDSYGFIWHGGNGGLFKYDGYESKACRSESADSATINLGTVHAILEEKNGDLLVGSTTGLFRYERQTDKIVSCYKGKFVKRTGGASIVYALYKDAAGRLWVGTETNLYVIKKPDTEPEKVLEGQDFPDGWQFPVRVYSIMEDNRGKIYAASSEGLWQVRPDFSFRRLTPNAAEKSISLGFRISDAETADGDTIWLAASTGLWMFETKNEHFHQVLSSENLGKRLMELTINHEKQLWLAISGQIWERSADGSMVSLTGPPAPFFHTISIVTTDRFGNLWAGGYNGLVKIELAANRALPFYKVVGDTPDQDNASLRLMQDSAGGFWFRMINSGLGYCTELGGTFEVVLQPALDVATEEIKHFCTDAEGNVWVLTLTKGLYRFPKGSQRWQQVLADDSMRVASGHTILSDRQDERMLWFSSKFGLCRINRYTLQRQWFFPLNDLPWLDKQSIGFIEQDDEGNIWCATLANTRNVVIRFDRTSGKFSGEPDPAKRPDYIGTKHLKRVSKDTLWLATTMGMLVIDTHRKTQFFWNRSNGFPTSGAGSIAPDGRGNVWFTSGRKIWRWDGRRFECFSARKESEGFLYANATRTRDGRIMLGGKGGLHVFEPEKIRKDTIRPRLYLCGFKVLNNAYHLGKALELVREIELPFDSKVITFEFAAAHHLRPGDVKYRHKLEGFEPEWVETGSRERWATYTNLSPGTYTFKVLAANADGLWSTEAEELSIRLVILPPLHRTWWAYLSYALAIGALLYGIRRYDLKRQLAKAEAARLQELDGVKTRLYTNITHEFRTPLTVILGMADKIEEAPRQWLREGVQTIRRNGRNLLRLVNQMLDLARLEGGALPLTMRQGDIVAHLKTLTEMYRSYADAKNIAMEFVADPEHLVMDYDPDKIGDIVSNLLSNALKFTPERGKITVTVSKEQWAVGNPQSVVPHRIPHTAYCLLLTVQDTGSGIAPEKLPYIFDRFYQADDSATRRGEGTGIGLALTHELVKLLGGSIEVQSEQGQGTAFIVRLPVSNEAPLQEALPAPQPVVIEIPAPQQAPSGRTAGKLPLALIVEDNADVTRLLVANLQDRYRIETAPNGREGVEKAIKIIPDVIISDVMMPEMDGFELCRTLKEDMRSSHIPIVLLTARADVDSRIEGLEMGADAYLAKPFNQQELEVSLRKSLELRERLRERYAGGHVPDEPATAVFGRDDAFVHRLNELLHANYAHPHFSARDIEKGMLMSSSQLLRKMKSLLNTTPQKYLRSYRLKQAKHLLETTDMKANEVGDTVGFGDQAYFTNAFSREFGMPPGAWREG